MQASGVAQRAAQQAVRLEYHGWTPVAHENAFSHPPSQEATCLSIAATSCAGVVERQHWSLSRTCAYLLPVVHGVHGRHGWVNHDTRMLVAYVAVRGPELLEAFLAAHVHTTAFRTFLRTWFSAPFAGIPRVIRTCGNAHDVAGGTVYTPTRQG